MHVDTQQAIKQDQDVESEPVDGEAAAAAAGAAEGGSENPPKVEGADTIEL